MKRILKKTLIYLQFVIISTSFLICCTPAFPDCISVWMPRTYLHKFAFRKHSFFSSDKLTVLLILVYLVLFHPAVIHYLIQPLLLYVDLDKIEKMDLLDVLVYGDLLIPEKEIYKFKTNFTTKLDRL